MQEHEPVRPRADYHGQPVPIEWCPACRRYFHQEHDCAVWAREEVVA